MGLKDAAMALVGPDKLKEADIPIEKALVEARSVLAEDYGDHIGDKEALDILGALEQLVEAIDAKRKETGPVPVTQGT